MEALSIGKWCGLATTNEQTWEGLVIIPDDVSLWSTVGNQAAVVSLFSAFGFSEWCRAVLKNIISSIATLASRESESARCKDG